MTHEKDFVISSGKNISGVSKQGPLFIDLSEYRKDYKLDNDVPYEDAVKE